MIDVFAIFNGKSITAKFNPDSRKVFLKHDEQKTDVQGLSPSTAAMKVMRQFGGSENSSRNGWFFWKFIAPGDNEEKYINELR